MPILVLKGIASRYPVELVLVPVNSDDGSFARQNTAVGQAEIADGASKDDQIGFLESLFAMLPCLKEKKEGPEQFSSTLPKRQTFYLKRTVGSEEAPRHAAQVAWDAQSVDGPDKLVTLGRRDG